MGHIGYKTRSVGQILENLVYTIEALFSNEPLWNFVYTPVLKKQMYYIMALFVPPSICPSIVNFSSACHN